MFGFVSKNKYETEYDRANRLAGRVLTLTKQLEEARAEVQRLTPKRDAKGHFVKVEA